MRSSEKVKNLTKTEDLFEAYLWLASNLGVGKPKKRPAAAVAG